MKITKLVNHRITKKDKLLHLTSYRGGTDSEARWDNIREMIGLRSMRSVFRTGLSGGPLRLAFPIRGLTSSSTVNLISPAKVNRSQHFLNVNMNMNMNRQGFKNALRGYSSQAQAKGTETAKDLSVANSAKPEQTLQKEEESDKRRNKQFAKLFNLAKPEVRLLIGALACLIITSAVSMSLPLLIGKIIDTVKEPDATATGEEKEVENIDEGHIFGLAPEQFYSGVAVVFVVGSIANFGRTYLLRSVGEKLVARLRLRLFAKILSQDSYFFDVGPTGVGMKTGDLISRISLDTQIILKTLSTNINDGVRLIVSGVVGLSMMCFVSWKLTLCMSMMFPPLILMSMVYGRRIKQLLKTIQENLGLLTKVSEEKLNGLKTIQSFAQQQLVVHDFNQEVKHIFQTSMQEGKLSGFYYAVNGFIGNAGLIGLLVVGTQFIGSGDITLGDLSSFMMYALYTGSSVFGLGNFYTELMKGVGASERIFELIELKPTITTSLGRKVPDLTGGDIKFKDIEFSYPSRPDSQIFDKPLELTIKKGEHVCFVGPSGSGKSTISQLLLRFYDPVKGTVTVNDYDIKDLNLNFFRSELGYVQQEPLLFSGTIRDNILFGKRGDNNSGSSMSLDEQIINATKLSNAYEFIQSFPDKFDTIIGANGAQLSGGQKQRISLARTLVKNPKILILDEATSALDSLSEERVMQNLNKLSEEQGTTMILIAHRLSTIKNSENIIVLNSKGEIVEEGKFDLLYADANSKLNRLLKNHEY